jgi:hypothetical protein
MTLPAEGRCYVCYKAGRGLKGEERAKALAAVKARIESGAINKRGGCRGSRKPAPAGGEKDRDAHIFTEGLKAGVKVVAGDESAAERGAKIRAAITALGKPGIERHITHAPAAAQYPAGIPADIPVTIRLMVEISVRVTSISS